ncbi:MAG TPA: hypothetical protein VFQ39_05985 [Longimicrobium sp.]|nr:hypothetical protein [Longimicrobium sp.]
MRRALLYFAVTLIVAVATWWIAGDPAFSAVPGWGTPILAPNAIPAILFSVILVVVAFAIIYREFRLRRSLR